MSATTRMPVIFISHGGGPCFQMPDPEGKWTKLRNAIASIPKQLPVVPKALLIISAHWEESNITVNSGANPNLYYDYGGFPPETYRLSWPAPGAPELAKRVASLLNSQGVPTGFNSKRGYDHGVFVPMLVAWPNPEIPVLQVSLHANLDPTYHFKLGEALAPLRDEGVLIIGSGFTFHNLRKMFSNDPDVTYKSAGFSEWLDKATCSPSIEERKRLLCNAGDLAPYIWDCHPRLEHLLPVQVCAGAAGVDKGEILLSDTLFGRIRHSSFWFGARK